MLMRKSILLLGILTLAQRGAVLSVVPAFFFRKDQNDACQR
jgi:hypothetical protein